MTTTAGSQLAELADRVRQKLITRANPNDLRAYRTQPEARERLHRLVRELVTQEASALGVPVTDATVLDVVQDLLGYGPIQPLLEDPTVSEVLVNGPEEVYVERAGRLEPVPVRFRDADHLRTIIERIVGGAGRRIDESSPMADARLPDGSRVNAVLPPVALDGPYLTIRRFARRLTADELLAAGTVTPDALAFLAAAVAARANVLVSGGTGTGKTTMLNALSGFIPPDERIVTIEDTAELQLQQPHVVRLETRPPNVEGKGEITIRHLVRNALRVSVKNPPP